MINLKQITVEKDEVLLINGALAVSLVKGCSALPVVHGNALKISGNIDSNPIGYSSGNSGYHHKEYKNKAVYIQPGIQIPHEAQVPRCYLVAAGAMFWRTTRPITHPGKVYEKEENAMYWKHGEIVYNEETGESTFHGINKTVEKLWIERSYPLLIKQLTEIEVDNS